MIDLSLVPRDVHRNLEWRAEILRGGLRNEGLRSELWSACSRSFPFYLNSFVWTEDPRSGGLAPFVTWASQDVAIGRMVANFGTKDMAIEKSRDEGASWICVALFEWAWHFGVDVHLGIVSRKEEYVDKRGDMKALFPKIDFIHARLPKWLMPKYERRMLLLENLDSGNTISGESTTGSIFRGARLTAMMLDEFAAFKVDDSYKAMSSTRDTTHCRIFNSTYDGVYNAFYDVTHNIAGVELIRLHWTGNPRKKGGLYTSTDGILEILDKGYEFPVDYAFVLDGKTRSPWYDVEETRCANKFEMAQEVDCDPIGGDYHFFDDAIIEIARKRDVRPAMHVGDLTVIDGEVVGLSDTEHGSCRIWRPLTQGHLPRRGRYVIGCDIALGTGATPSVLVVMDASTGEKVLEYVNNLIRPHEFGNLACLISEWLIGDDGDGALLNWEVNGAGRTFTLAVRTNGYGRVYVRRNIETGREETGKVGFSSDQKSKIVLLQEYRRAMHVGDYINRSAKALDECVDYIRTETGVEHIASKHSQEINDKGDNHGDRVIADAICWWAARRYVIEDAVESKREVDGLYDYIQRMEAVVKSEDTW